MFTHGVTHTTVRTPAARKSRTIAVKSVNWCGLGSHVLYCVSHGESSTTRVERDRVARAAMDVVLDVVLVRVDVARLPEAVAPLRQHRRQAARAQIAAQARRGGGVAEQRQPQRAGARARRDDRLLVAELEAHAVAVAVRPDGVAARGLKPRRGRVVALRDAAVGEQVRRAVGPGVGAIGAELDPPARVVDAQRMAGAEPGEVLARAAVPVGGDAQRLALERRARASTVSAPGSVIDSRPQRPPSQRMASSTPSASGSATLAATTRSGSPSSSRATTPSVNWMNRSSDLALDRPHAEPADEPPAAAPHVDARTAAARSPRAAGRVRARGRRRASRCAPACPGGSPSPRRLATASPEPSHPRQAARGR